MDSKQPRKIKAWPRQPRKIKTRVVAEGNKIVKEEVENEDELEGARSQHNQPQRRSSKSEESEVAGAS